MSRRDANLAATQCGRWFQDFSSTIRRQRRAASLSRRVEPRRALQRDWSRFLEATHGWAWRDVRRAFGDLGGAWLPASRAALADLFSAIN
jgi:hypothetical protein